MERTQIVKTMLDVINAIKHTSFTPEQVTEETYLGGDMGIQSVEMLEAMYDIQKALDVTIEDKEMSGLYTVGDVVNLIERCRDRKD